MTWPPPPLRVDQTNTLVQFNNHPADHVAVNTRVNLLADQMPVFCGAGIVTTDSAALDNGAAEAHLIVGTPTLLLRAGHWYRAAMFVNFYANGTYANRRYTVISQIRLNGVSRRTVSCDWFDSESNGTAVGFVTWYQGGAGPVGLEVWSWMSSTANGVVYAPASASDPNIIELVDLGLAVG